MHTLKLKIEDSIFDKVIDFLQNLPNNEVEIVESKITQEDWSHLEKEIDKGVNSGMSNKSHKEIIDEIKKKYV